MPSQTTFPATAVTQTAGPVTVTLIAQAAGNTTAPVALTSGIAGMDFATSSVDPGTCASTASVSVGDTCTVTVLFTPQYPGLRLGAVVLESPQGEVLASAMVSGIGTGGLPVLIPGEINTVAGNGHWVYEGDDVPATETPICLPSGLAVDAAGNLYLSDSSNNRVRRVDASTGRIEAVAGNGNAGSLGDNNPATSAELNNPSGLAVDGAGNLYIADSGNNTIRRVDAVTHNITTVAGSPGVSGFGGDGGPATSALLASPQGLALTPSGDLVIADTNNARVRVLTMSDAKIQTIAGTGAAGYNGDGTATSKQLSSPWGVAVRLDGVIAIADLGNNRVRLVDLAGNMTTVAGNGQPGFSGDNADATQAELNEPAAVAFDPAGDLLIADSGNNLVRGVYGSPGPLITLSGKPNDEQFAGDLGPANAASMYAPYGLVFDQAGNLWFSDMFHNRVREISGSVLGIGYSTMKVSKTSPPVFETMYNAGNAPLNVGSPTLDQAALDPNETTCAQSQLLPTVFCNMGIEFAPQHVGANISGSVTWVSDAHVTAPVDQLNGEVLSVEPTTVVITSSQNPGLQGQPLTLTATVSSADTGRTGTVDFVEGGTTWCSGVSIAGDGTATCQIGSLSLGTHNFTASYSGDSNNAASTSDVFVETVKQQPAVALAVPNGPAVVTSNVTVTVNVAAGTGTPTGTVQLYDGSTPLTTLTLDANGNASWSTQTFAVGTHPLSAQYSGDSSNAPRTSNVFNEQIVKATTVTVLSLSDSSATVGTNLVLTARVVSQNGPAPTGSVQFYDGATLIGSGTVATDGTATTSVSNLAPGVHNLVANYGGDDDNATSSANAAENIQQIATGVTLVPDANPLSAGATLHLVASVSIAGQASADGAISGTVTFSDGGIVLGTVALDANGQASIAASALSVGSHQIVASFSGSTNYAASSSAVLNESVHQTSTSVALNASSATTLMGKAASFTAVVSSGTGVPTGTVTFKDGSTVLATVTLDAHGSASLSTTVLSPGVHTITAVYGGDANYVGASSAGVQQTVQLAQPTLTLSGPASAVDAGVEVRFTAVLGSPGIAPTGRLTLLDGGATVGTDAVTGAGTFTFSTAGLALGTHTLMASYGGDANNASAMSVPITVVVQQASTATVLVASANPLTQGGSLSLTATVTSDSPNAGGAVNFYDGGTLLGTAALGANGTASLAPQNLSLGTHAITAVYAGDVNHAGSTSAPVSELVVQSASAALSSSVNPSVSGQNVTFTAHIAGTPVPTGTVSFRDNGTLLATVPLNSNGVATLSTASLSVGAHAIAVSYSGDQDFSTATAQMSQAVLNASTEVTLATSANPGTYGQPLVLSALVGSDGGAATGTVSFTDGGVVIGSAQLDANSKAVFSTSALAPGPHTIAAEYLGDGKASPSNSAPVVVIVKQTTVLVVGSSANPAQTLMPVSFTASVTNAGAAPAGGTVSFSDGAAVLGTAAIDSTGKATLTLPQMNVGTHNIVATYAGDGVNFGSQSAAFSETVQLRPTGTTVTGTPTDPNNPQQMTLIAVVRGDGSVPPSGTVVFAAGNVTLGAAMVDATGVASITVNFGTKTQSVVASYPGDASYAGSQSSATSITAGDPAQFTLAVDAPNVTLVSHQRTTVNVTVGSVKGFTDTIALGCLGLPYAATCTFDKTQLKLAADGSATASLTIDTGDPLGAGTNVSAVRPGPRGNWMCLLPAGLMLGGLMRRGRRKRIGTLLVLLMALAVAVGASGCSGLQMSGTPAGSYSFRVIGTGQGSNTTESQPISLVVTQ